MMTYSYWPDYYWPFTTSEEECPSSAPALASGTVEQLVKNALQQDESFYGSVGARVYIDTDLSAGFRISDEYAATVRTVGGSESEGGTVQQVLVEVQCYGPDVTGALSLAQLGRSALVGFSSGQLKRVELARPAVLRRREGGLPYYELQVRVWYANN
jgi:hypothetical protein